MSRAAFPDFNLTVDDMVAEGDKVVARITWRGTHKDEYMGIAPTDKQVTMEIISIYRVEGGKLAEQWAKSDTLNMMQQLGVGHPPG